MTLKRAASCLLLLLLVTVGLFFAAAQRLPHVPQGGPQLPGALPLPASGPAGPAGVAHGGPVTPADLARAASQRNLSQAQLPAAGFLAPAPASPIFFTAPTYRSGGTGAYSVAVGDVNGDGKPDLLVANEVSSSVGVLLSNGDGTFQAAVSYGSGGQDASSVAVGDVNGDGKLDLLVANVCATSNCANGGSVGVLLGNGDGTFQAAVSYGSGGQDASSVAMGDVNGDGKLDMVVVNYCGNVVNCYGAGSVSVLLGNGDGTFQAAVSYGSGGLYAGSVAVGDVNGDGKLDLVVPNQCSTANNCANGGAVSVLLGNGDGTFQAAVSYGTGGQRALSVVVGDVNGDGKLDLIVANECVDGNCGDGGSVGVLQGNGDGTFLAAVSYRSSGVYTLTVAVGDVNGDGKPDLVVVNQCSTNSCLNGSVDVLLGNGDGTFHAASNYGSGGRNATSVAVGDVNEDGKPDLLVANQCYFGDCPNGSVEVLLGNGDGTFQAAPSYGSGGLYASSVAVGDVNGDGKPDLLVTIDCTDNICAKGSVGVLLGNGDGTFQTAVSYGSGGQYALSVAVGDVNGDGKPDLLVANECVSSGNCANGGSVSVLLGNGDGTFQVAVSYGSGGQYAYSVAVGDVNGDGKLDLLVANENADSSGTNGSVSVLLGNGDGTFQAAVPYGSGGRDALSVAVGDVNGDGKPDLVVANECADSICTNGLVSVLLGNGDGTFQAALPYSSGGQYAFSAAVGDVNKDGTPDLVVANYSSVGVLLGNGDGTFQTAASTPTPSGGFFQPLALADFDGDGNLDVASGIGNFLLLGNGDGTLQAPIPLGAPGSGIAAGDFNRDGKPDLAVANGSSVTILRNIAANFHYATTTVVTSSLNPARGGQPVTFSATVTPAFNAGALTGGATFYDGASALGTVAISNGQATFSTSSLSLGTHAITAAYAGDTNYLASTSAALTETINSSATTTALGSSLNPSSFGQSLTFTATVTAQGPGAPTGSVTFSDGTNPLGTTALSGGVAAVSAPLLGAGSHSITATYSGDSNFNSSSGSLTQNVNQATTAIAATSTPNPSTFNQTVTFTATVTPQYGGQATGVVAFVFQSGRQTNVQVSNNTATLQADGTLLPAGTDWVVAKYLGDSNFSASTSSPLTQTVNQATSSVVLTSSGSPSIYGQNVTFTAAIAPQNGGVATGTSTFKDGAALLAIVSVAGNAASFSTTTLGAGTHSITSTYSGDGNVAGSTSSAFSQVVNQSTTTVALTSSVNPSYVGQTVTFTTTVTGQQGGAVTGSVAFKQGVTTLATVALLNGQAAYSTTYTTTGTRSITAVYSGDSNNLASTSAVLKQVVNSLPAATITQVATSGSPSLINQLVTFTAKITSTDGPIPDGETVTFYDGTAAIGTGLTAGGVATFQTSTLAAKTNTIKATYSGDATFKSSWGTVTQVVNLYASTTTVTSSPNLSTYGQTVGLMATVTSGAPGGPIGTVTFKNGATTLGTATLSGGTALLSTTKLPAGTLTTTASYSGDAQSGKSSGTTTQTVNQATTNTAVRSSVNPSIVGQTVKFTATVTSPTTTPTGMVKFMDGNTVLGTGTLAGGKASFSTSTLSSGSHNITAVYGGTTNIVGSTSPVLAQTVN